MNSVRLMPSYQDVLAARERIKDSAIETPLLENRRFNKLVSSHVWVKAEPLQHTGSFKFRGAANRLLLLTQEQRSRGVVAFSSGNHALAVAAAAKSMGIRAGVVMPTDAPKSKIDAVRALGAHVSLHNRRSQDREAIAARLVQEWGAVLVPPYDDAAIIAGQGTLAVEMIEQLAKQRTSFDVVFIGCSGGGLSAGCALAFEKLCPKTKLYVVEPEGFDDTGRSLREGHRVANTNGAKTICDALMVTRPGELTFDINRRLLSGGIIVSDKEVRAAMRVAFEYFKVVCEPGGAAALAGFLQGKIDCKDKVVGIVLSGGNVDADLYATALDQRMVRCQQAASTHAS